MAVQAVVLAMTHAVICTLTGLFVAAQAVAPQAVAPTVARLVRQLDATEKARREDAERQLLELGPAALPHLPAPDAGSAEVRLRVARIRTQLETRQGEEQVQASQVTISGKELSLADVLSGIEKQTTNKLVDFRNEFGQQAGAKSLNLDLERTPFWPAVDQILDQAGMTIYSYAGVPGLSLVNRAGDELPRYKRGVYAGAFRIEATDITARRDLRDPNGHTLKLAVQVAWEPRLAPIAITQAAANVTGVGDNGETLAAGSAGEFEATVNPGDSSADMPLTFALPSRDMKKIARLKGSFGVMMPGQVEAFRFDKLGEDTPREQRRGAVKVVLDQVRRNNDVWEVRTRIVFDTPGRALESHRTWVLHNEAVLETPDKKTIDFAGLETTRQTESEVGVSYLFDVPDIAGCTFVYTTPTVLLNASVPYELHDIPLP